MDDNENLIIDEDVDYQTSEGEIEKKIPDSIVEIKEEATTSKQVIPESSTEKNLAMAKKVVSTNSADFKRPSSSTIKIEPKRMKSSDGLGDQDLSTLLVCNLPKYYNEDKIAEFFMKSCKVLRHEIFSIKIFQNTKKGSIGSVLLKLFNSTVCKKVLKVINGMHVDGKLLHATLDTGGHLEAIFNVNKSLAQKCSQNSFNGDDEIDEDPLRYSNDGVPTEEKTVFGFSEEFLNKIGVKEPLSEIIIVENIPLEATDDKLGYAFALAGFVEHIDIKDGTAMIEYSNPVEAIQAVSMFNGQQYFGNVLKVTIATEPSKRSIIPEGFKNLGPGLGKFGKPLPNIATYLLADREEKKRDDVDNGDSDILNRIRNTLSKVKSVETKYGIHPKRIISFLNDMLIEHIDDNDMQQNRDPRIASSSRSQKPISLPIQSPQNSGYVSPRGPIMEPGQFNFNMQYPNQLHANNIRAPVISHGPVQYMGPPFQSQGPVVGQFQSPQRSIPGQFQPQGPHIGHCQPQGLPVAQFQPQGPPVGQFQPQGPPAGQFQPQGPPAGQFQPQGPPAGQFQPQRPSAGQFQPQRPSASQFQSQGPAVNHAQPAAPPVCVNHNNSLKVQGPPHGMVNRGPEGDTDNKDMVIFENLPASVTSDILLEKAQKCGHVKFLHLTATGTAFVRYYNRESAERCLSMFANSKVDGHHIHVRFF